MKRGLLVFAAVMLFSACDEKPKNPVAEYGDAMINSYQKGMKAGEVGNLDAVRKALQAYHASNDKYPQNLEEIKPMLDTELDFSKYNYNPENGTVTLKVN